MYNEVGSISSNVFLSTNGTTYWKPDVSAENIPVLGMIFDKWDDVVNMYKSYAVQSGFSPRLSTLKVVKGFTTHRYILCSRAGKPNFQSFDSAASSSISRSRRSKFKVRGTKTDYKNFVRDIRLFIGDRDAQMIVDSLEKRVLNRQNFSFEFTVVGTELRSLFWVDDVMKCNYEAFGDVLAFDATYGTNMYKMIFVPFTGVDHHKRCVTFAAGLLCDETIESYKWLLSRFLDAHKKQPLLVLTDQDAAMKQAVATVFNESIHRLCMWHIMRKLPVKISGDLLENTNLRACIHKLVWNLFITPSVFEEKWQLLMDEYHLDDHPWLSEMYAIREQWVPCYFRELQMCCLMKTTSRCESSNALFKVNSSGANTLVQFLLCFDNSIDGQRYNQRLMEFESVTTTPLMLTVLPIEKHASEIYSRTIFLEVQKEIRKGMLYCFMVNSGVVYGTKTYTVAHTDRHGNIVNEFQVTLELGDNSVSCDLLGKSQSVDVSYVPPQGIRNKGCGTAPRLIGPGEKAIENAKKRKGTLRLCGKCKKYVDHDSRNCEKMKRLAAGANVVDHGPSTDGSNSVDPGPSIAGP
ncbi:hypothetical protein QVD17_41693 [Tagetes erecta]|uniref:MULE transposase domain-containing protein n=1 Tax=Tagetes erecta TaxID=13708 RepID=A0AAD8NFS6_TARER|nr:hypothetical protein QVD17_41693 [Tagetes erecta]